jgi:hypothetical protein
VSLSRLLRLRSLLSLTALRPIGFTAGRSFLHARFRARGSSWFAATPSPEQFDPLGSSFLAFAPPQSSFASRFRGLHCSFERRSHFFEPLAVFRHELSPTRVSALLMTSLDRVHTREVSQASLRSVLRRSQPPDGFLRVRARRLISSRSHVQDQSVQGLLSPGSRTRSSRAVAPLLFLSRMLTGCPAATCESPSSEALLHREQRGHHKSG